MVGFDILEDYKDHELMKAICDDDCEKVRDLVKGGADINEVFDEIYPLGCFIKSPNMMATLINNGYKKTFRLDNMIMKLQFGGLIQMGYNEIGISIDLENDFITLNYIAPDNPANFVGSFDIPEFRRNVQMVAVGSPHWAMHVINTYLDMPYPPNIEPQLTVPLLKYYRGTDKMIDLFNNYLRMPLPSKDIQLNEFNANLYINLMIEGFGNNGNVKDGNMLMTDNMKLLFDLDMDVIPVDEFHQHCMDMYFEEIEAEQQ